MSIKTKKNDKLIAAQELKRFLISEKYRSHKPYHAFIIWYNEACFGQTGEIELLDAKKDGGIDAIIRTKDETFILQSKYEETPRLSLVNSEVIAEFEKLSDLFRNSKRQDEFDDWLKTVRSNIASKYKILYKEIQKLNVAVRFLFITTQRFNLPKSTSVEVVDIEKIASLWEIYQEGFTPPVEKIDIQLEKTWHYSDGNSGFKTYVGLADVTDFLKLMEKDRNERLFAQNVRTDLRSRINKGIRITYEEQPDRFWLGNNGIYIICKKVFSSGDIYSLTYPSIINGSQTLHSLSSSAKRHSCKILVRILEMDLFGSPVLLSEIVRRTNTQNPMKLVNLSSNDIWQINIARFLDSYKIFYERREKEWQNEKKSSLVGYFSIDIKGVAQWLSLIYSNIGFGQARSNPAEIFHEKNYKDIFHAFDPDFSSRRYAELPLILWSGLFIDNCSYYYPKTYKNFIKVPRLLFTKATLEAIKNDPKLQNIIDKKLKAHEYGRKNIPQPLKKIYRECVEKLRRLQKKEERINPNVDYSNYFKRNELTQEAYRKIFNASTIRKLALILKRNIGKVY